MRKLSTREVQIIDLAAQGCTHKEIAAKLYLGEGTVKNCMSVAYSKLGATNKAHAVTLAIESGLLPSFPVECAGAVSQAERTLSGCLTSVSEKERPWAALKASVSEYPTSANPLQAKGGYDKASTEQVRAKAGGAQSKHAARASEQLLIESKRKQIATLSRLNDRRKIANGWYRWSCSRRTRATQSAKLSEHGRPAAGTYERLQCRLRAFWGLFFHLFDCLIV